MWSLQYQNGIVNQFDKLNEQRLHIERVLSVKGKTNTSRPLKPKFLKTKLKKAQMEEEEKEKIDYENHNLLLKIIKAELNPSKYSISVTPKECPAFNKDIMYEKRMKKEFDKYKNNLELYTKLSKVKATYDTKKIYQKTSIYDEIVKRIKKPNRILNPCLFFQSPTYIKKRLGLERRNSFYEETKELLSKSCCTLDKEKRASSAISQRGKKRI